MIYFVYLLSTLNSVSVTAAQVVFSLYALKLGAGPFTIGTLAAMFALIPMFIAITAGRLVDRYGGRWPMTAGAFCGGLGMLLPFFFASLPAIFCAALMCGLAQIFFALSTQNLVGMLSTPETRARYFANYTLTTSLANFLGPLVGGASIDHFSHANTCVLLSSLTLLPFALLLIRGNLLPGGTHRTGTSSGGIRAMLNDPFVRRTLATGSLVNVGINLYQFYMPVYAHVIGLSASAIGAVLAMNSAATFVVRFVLPQLIAKLGEEQLLAYAFYVGASSLALIPFFHQAWELGLISFLFGLGMGCGQPIVIMLMFSNSKDGRSGESLGLKFTINQFTKMVSPVVFGSIAALLGLSPMFWINAAMMVGGGLMSARAKNRTTT